MLNESQTHTHKLLTLWFYLYAISEEGKTIEIKLVVVCDWGEVRVGIDIHIEHETLFWSDGTVIKQDIGYVLV